MPDDQRMNKGFAPLANVARLMAMIDQCQSRDMGVPGMGCYFGRSGRGKTMAAIHASNSRYSACHIEASPLGGVKKLLQMIVEELEIKPARSSADLFDQAARALAMSGRPLIIDEADLVLSDTKIETIRHLHDKSGVAVILMGEESLPQKLQRWERVHRRILGWVEAEAATMEDVTLLAGVHAHGVEITADLKAEVLRVTKGSQGYIANNLVNLRVFATTRGLTRLSMPAIGEFRFATGEPPAMQRPGIPGIMARRRGAA